MSARVIVGLGGNLGDRRATLDAAVAAIAALPRTTLRRRSSLYETDPVGPSTRPFLNAAVELSTTLEPTALLEALLRIEREHGRVRGERWAARTLDLDILVWHDGEVALRVASPGLTIPHPRLGDRDFALAPLTELAPAEPIDGGMTASQQLARLPVNARTIRRKMPWG